MMHTFESDDPLRAADTISHNAGGCVLLLAMKVDIVSISATDSAKFHKRSPFKLGHL